MSEGAVKKEEKPRKFQAIRGTRDLLPPETALWNRVEQAAHAVFGTFGFGEIRLPIFEPTELFAKSIGEETDVVSKEMYTFEAYTDKFVAVFSEMRRILVKEDIGSKNPILRNLQEEFKLESKRGTSLTLRPLPSAARTSNTTCSNCRSR